MEVGEGERWEEVLQGAGMAVRLMVEGVAGGKLEELPAMLECAGAPIGKGAIAAMITNLVWLLTYGLGAGTPAIA